MAAKGDYEEEIIPYTIISWVLAQFRGCSTTISKGQVMALVGHTASHSVHQQQSSVSNIVTILSTNIKAWQEHTLMHKPHPLHFSWFNLGISTKIFTPHLIKYYRLERLVSVTIVSYIS
jgi:hypothetical protein